MSENRFVTILIILVFVLSGFIGWHLLSPQGGDKEISINKQASILDSVQENTVNKEAKMISSRDSVSITIASDRSRIDYYERGTGIAFEVGLNGSLEKALSSTRLPNFLSTIWSPNKKEVISEFAAPGNLKSYSYYNYTTKKSSKLPSGIKSLAFSPSGDKVAYFKKESDGLFGLFVSAPDGSIPQRIVSTRIEDAKLFWPSKDAISLISTDESQRSSLFLVSMDGKFKKVISDKSLLSTTWRGDGDSVLVSYMSEDSQVLSIIDSAVGSEKVLGISADANECAWSSSESVVCRISKNSNGSSLDGGLYDINIQENSQAFIQGSVGAANGINEILVDPTNSYIIFTSARDGKIFSLKR
ncbi:MAG: hypothetical protein AAB561_01295 [Patescibacteria group bacterium]